MSSKSIVALLALGLLSVSPALASFSGGGSKPEDSPSGSTPAPGSTQALTPRQDAERNYGDAYEDVAKAQKELAAGKKKNADKKFKRAMERGEHAVELDTTYHEAWNLVGFCARNLTLYDRSLAAYGRCLALKPDYAPAREYLGEALVELGRIREAREQLVWLERLNAAGELQTLKTRIDTWAAAHPDSSAAPASAPAPLSSPASPADSTASGSSSGDRK